VCNANILPTTDRGICCDSPCSKTESCEGVKCPEEQKCVRGNCIDKTCAERELPLCAQGEMCTDEYYKDGLGIVCCTDECRRPCVSDANCSIGEMCKDDYCIVKECSDIGGKTCDAKTEECTGEMERTVDNEECCLQCGLKKCEEMEGIVCNASNGEECSKSTIVASDTAECCLDECEGNWCIDTPCAINKKCVEERCVLKTCEEMEGVDWEEQETCEGSFYITGGIQNCCIPQTCEELLGIECQPTEECDQETRLSTDVTECCLGNCT
jgi:hypothetical protein